MTPITIRRRENAALALACVSLFIVVLDATIVSVALPRIRGDLGFSVDTLPWVVNAYTLAFAGFLLLGGRCADRFGARRVHLFGTALFTLGLAFAGAATAPVTLLAARAVQGLGGALLMPVTLTIVTTTFTESARRARALGLWSAVGAIGAASGPLLGGPLTELCGWRSAFFAPVPLGVGALIVAARVLAPTRPGRAARLDAVGALSATGGLVATIYAVTKSTAAPTVSVATTFAAGIALLLGFLARQAHRADDALVPLRLFRSRTVVSGNGVMLLLGLGFFASPILLSLSMQDVMGYGPMRAGVGYLPIGIAMVVGARAAGACTARWGSRHTAVACCLVGATGFLGIAVALGVDAPYPLAIGLPGVLLGVGSAGAFTPVTMSATDGVAPSDQGGAAGLLNTTRQVSGAIGLAILTTLADTVARHSGPHDPTALSRGYCAAFAAAGVCLIAAGVTALVAMPRATHEPGQGT